ncbi:MAG: hypothetical protein HOY71_03620, partial [Nonomuraea sp.]|nr:hypothetical protein [Nonomuraea sp.]
LKADDACYRQAAEQVLHKKIKDQQDLIAQMTQEMDRAERRTLDTDPRLVAMARGYAGCMRGKGYAMPADTPSLIGSAEVKRFWKQRNDLGKLTPQLTPDEARPYLDKEIASALEDLECGKDFFRAYNPRYQAIWDEVSRRWGQG